MTSRFAAGLATSPNWSGPTVIADLGPQVSCCERLYLDLRTLEEPPALLVVNIATGIGHGCRAVMDLIAKVGGVFLAPFQPAAAVCWLIDALLQPGVPVAPIIPVRIAWESGLHENPGAFRRYLTPSPSWNWIWLPTSRASINAWRWIRALHHLGLTASQERRTALIRLLDQCS